MALAPGTRLGPYEIGAQIGVGGMGEVYRAQDKNLGRDVAIKVLPDALAQDPERVARFEREAKTLASLNHPNIAIIHGLEKADGVLALVMELVQGPTLADRVAQGPIAVDEALPIARQIAEAVETAHEQGVIHRDLKPANVKVRVDGTVKVLDFGLAKILEPVGATPSLSRSPTITTPVMTQAGVILGTAAYMSPEQAKGKPADERSDVWAFGCLLFEMFTGRRAFEGENLTDTIAATLRGEPDWSALPPDTPPLMKRLLHDCLIKERPRRIADLSTALFALRAAADAAPEPLRAARRWPAGIVWAAVAAVVVAAALAGVRLSRSNDAHTRQVVRSQILIPDTPLTPSGAYLLALDPAGTTLVFVGRRHGEPPRLYRRALDDDAVLPIDGTDGASGPLFSPDGQSLLFVQNGMLKRMPARGGASSDMAQALNFQGATFIPDGSVVFNAQHGEGLLRLRPESTVAEGLTTVDRNAGEAGHHWPHVLPDGRHVLITVEMDGKSYSEARIELLSLESGERQLLINNGTDARYVVTGHIVYWRAGDLWAVPFDLARLKVVGVPVPVVRNVMAGEAWGQARYSISSEGTLVYAPGPDPFGERALMLVDRSGAARPLSAERKAFVDVVVSPDGARLATQITAANDSLWVFEFDHGTLTPLTLEAENGTATWSPDGSRLAFSRYRGGEGPHIYVMPANGSGMPELQHESTAPEVPQSWSRNGDMLAFVRLEGTHSDIWVMPMTGERKPHPITQTRFDEQQARVSPNGHWIAYASNESGRFEVYVQPFPGIGTKRPVSVDGGHFPRWRGDGREIFYRHVTPGAEATDEAALMVAEVKAAAEFSLSRPRVLFKGRIAAGEWDVLPDGQHFVFIEEFAKPRTAITIVQNWFEDLKRLVPMN